MSGGRRSGRGLEPLRLAELHQRHFARDGRSACRRHHDADLHLLTLLEQRPTSLVQAVVNDAAVIGTDREMQALSERDATASDRQLAAAGRPADAAEEDADTGRAPDPALAAVVW